MLKLDFSDLQENGFKLYQLRLFHSSAMREKNFQKSRDKFIANGDERGEIDHVNELMIEQNEITYTLHLIFHVLSYIFLFIPVPAYFFFQHNIIISIASVLLSLVCYVIYRRKREDYILGNMEVDVMETLHKKKMKDKYNF